MNFAEIKDFAVETFNDWNEDKAPRLAAALAYYTVFSLAPLLVIVIAIAGLFLGQSSDQAQGQVISQIATIVGQDAADAIGELLQSANRPQLGSISGILGVIALLFGAAGLFGQLQDSLNTIWEVAPKPGRGIWGMIKDRFFSFSMVLGTGFLLLVSLLLTTALSAIGRSFVGEAFDQTPLWQVVNFVVSLVATWLLFTLIFKVIPDVEIAWRDVLLGAALTAVLFAIGRWFMGAYLANASTTSAYGAAGSLVLLLIWVYYSAQILFMGAEFTQVYARRYGSRIKPADNAVPVTEEARANQGMPTKGQLEAGKRAAEGQPAGQPTGERAREVGERAPREGAYDEARARAARDDDTIGGTVGGKTRTIVGRVALLSALVAALTGRGKKR